MRDDVIAVVSLIEVAALVILEYAPFVLPIIVGFQLPRLSFGAAPRTCGDDPSRRFADYLAEIVGYNARAARTIYNDSSEIFAYSVEKYAKGGRGDIETAMFETARRKNARS